MKRLALPLVLCALAACRGGSGGGPGSAPASPEPAATPKTLHYTNPPAHGFRLEADPATNHTCRLVLNLKGPEGQEARGVAFFLQVADDRAVWVAPEGTSLARNGDVWNPGAAAPVLMRAKAAGGVLQVGVFERDGAAVVLDGRTLVSVALQFRGGKGPVSLAVPEGRAGVVLDGSRTLQPLALGIGRLEAR